MRRPRRVTSATWQGLSVEARADLYASEHTTDAMRAVDSALLLAGIELAGDAERVLRAALGEVLRDAYAAGSERETSLEVALGTERAIRVRLELAMRAAGLPVPTDRLPSDPP